MKTNYIQDQYYIAVFESKNHAVQLYQYLKRNRDTRYELISTPCRIKAGCSYSIKFYSIDDYENLAAVAQALKKEIASVYISERQNGRRTLRKINI